MGIQNRGVYAEHTEHYRVIANFGNGTFTKSGYEVYCFYELDDKQKYDIFTYSRDKKDLMNGKLVLYERIRSCRAIVNYNPSSEEILHYSKAVHFVGKEEFGNDYYYYAKLRPDLALKNFGLNKLTMNNNSLYYRNLNDSIDSQTHKCPDSLQTSANRDMLDTSGYAFYFHGEIVPKEQVFEEVPQAKEYYEKYCGKAE